MTSPWRYRCPECDAPSVTRVTSARRPTGETYPHGGEGAHRATTESEARYRCNACGERLEAVIDAAIQAPVQPDRL